ncbi:MAG: hypothetical protein HYZ71_06245 [Deltaproteobacteria bacterium]|nr:hypothetical protein [Deltaproteobacteria bacterium]
MKTIHVVASLFLISQSAVGAPFAIVDRASDVPSENALYTALNHTADQIESTINSGFLSDSSRANLNTAVAKASSSPGSSLWVDRASNPKRLDVGAGVQAQVNMTSLSLAALSFSTNNSLPAIGGSATGTLTVGLNPSLFGVRSDRLFLYLNGMIVSQKVSNADVQSTSFGLNGQYRLITPKSLILVGWGGLTFATGINYSSSFIGVSSNLNVTQDTDVSGQTVTMNMNLSYQLGVRSTVITVPLELSTNVSLLSLVTLFLGGGADINFGSASLAGSASGPVSASYTGSIAGSNLFSGTGALNLDDGNVARPDLVVGRIFAGIQGSLWVLKASASYTYITNQTHAIAALVRVAL